MAKLRHGFKAAAKRIALEERADLGVAVFAALDPYEHAARWGIRIYDLANGYPLPAREHFAEINPSAFSAILIPHGRGHIIVENHRHDPARRRSTIAHEMSHVILEHEFDVLLGNDNACRSSSTSLVEAEAAELSGELLIPSDAACEAARAGWSNAEVAAFFRVSLRMASWRMNSTGARLRADRARKRRQQ